MTETQKYHRGHLTPIRKKLPLTAKELLKQMKDDFNIVSKEEIEEAREIWKNNSEIAEWVKGLIENRESNKSAGIKIPQEYYYRAKILKKLFPEGFKRVLMRRKVDSLISLRQSVRPDRKTSSYSEWIYRVKHGKLSESINESSDPDNPFAALSGFGEELPS